jgi:tetratricopeptide (TPR) repeat protein/serine/threonine protein kinase
MSTTKQQRELIAAFAQEWGVPVSVVEQLLARTADIPTTDGEGLLHRPTTSDDEQHTIYEGDAPQPPAAGFGVAQPMRAEATISITDERNSITSSGVESRPFQLSHLGRYEDLGLLGVGGMGEVRQVRDPDLRRTLAMKIIHPRLLAHPRSVSRFIEEAQVEAQLQHPHIVPVHELGQLADGRHYFTMKEVRGTELSKKICAVHALSNLDRWRPGPDGTTFRDIVHIFRQVCDAVAFAHSQGVIHRDLKPDNIMIGDFGEVLVVDWGLAKVLGREESPEDGEFEDFVQTDRSISDAHQTRMGSIAGTPCYMAPEQAFGHTENVGMATDVYTLGSILYEILSGNPPFDGATAEEVLEKVKNSQPSVLRATEEDVTEEVGDDATSTTPAQDLPHAPLSPYAKIPDRLAEICERAMQREITDRTESAAVLAAEVKSWLEGAEKRDKGLEEVAVALQLSVEAQTAERQSIRFWEQANHLLEKEGVGSDTGWEQWTRHSEAAAEGRKLWRRYAHRLQGALAHAPELEEAHEALAQLRMDELFEATAVGDRLGQESLKQQLANHLQFLSTASRTVFELRIETGLTDGITSHRLSRGALVGRYEQREAVATQARAGVRFITLLGTAGVGKTRLALELAEDMRSGFERTVFCDLTQATDAMAVALHLSRALNVRLRDADPMEHLTEVLAEESTLMVLDNLEQVTSVVGPIIDGWLTQATSLQVICTSRQKLNAEAETVVVIQPMSLLEGVDLFVRRGQAADQNFELGQENRAAICSLVQRLDGLPLAIELAAARLNVFGVGELSQRLDERFSLLRSRGRDAQALEGALDWSWGLLEPWAKAALSQASLFRGGFTLAAAEGVIKVSDDEGLPGMFDILGELIDNSLLRGDQNTQGVVRYQMLESIRAYAAEKLETIDEGSPELRGPEPFKLARKRHAFFFSKMGTAESIKALDGFGSGKLWEALFGDLDNLVEGARHGTSKTAPRCCLAALKVLSMKGPMSLGVDLATGVLKMSGLQPRVQMLIEIERSRCLRISGRLDEARDMVMGRVSLSPDEVTESTPVEVEQTTQSDIASEALSEMETVLEDDAPEDVGDHGIPLEWLQPRITESDPGDTFQGASDEAIAEADRLWELGNIERSQCNFDEALQCLERARNLYVAHGDRANEGCTVGSIGLLYQELGQYERATETLNHALAIAREVNNKHNEASQLGALGSICRHQGEYERAIVFHSQAVDLAREIGDKRGEGIYLGNLGNVHRAQGNLEEAIEFFDQGAAIAREIGDIHSESTHLGFLGSIHNIQGRYEIAIEYFSGAAELFRQFGDTRSESVWIGNIGDTNIKLGRVDEAETALRRAISGLEETIPVAAGAFQGSLALLLANRGAFAEAQTLIEKAEPQIADHPEEYAKFLAKKGLVCHQAGNVDDTRTSLEQAQALAAELKVGDDSEVTQAIRDLEAVLEASSGHDLATAREMAVMEATRLMELGVIEREQGNHQEALRCFHQANEIAQQYKDQRIEGQAIGELGNIYRVLGQDDRAIAYYIQAIDIVHEVGNQLGEGNWLGNLGTIYEGQGQYARALECFNQALELTRMAGHRRHEGIRLGNMANVYQAQGEHDRALEVLTEALEIAREVGDQQSTGSHLGNIGLAHYVQGEHERAIGHYEQAIDMFRAMGAKRSEGINCGNLGDALFTLERMDEAETAYRTAIEILSETFQVGAGVFHGSLAWLIARKGQNEEAQEQLKKGEALVEPHPEEYAKFLAKKGHVCHLAGDADGARASLEQAQALAAELNVGVDSEVTQAIRDLKAVLGDCAHEDATDEERGLALVEVARLRELGTIARDQGKAAEALINFQDALALSRQHGDRQEEAKSLGALATVYLDQGKPSRAGAMYEQAVAIHREMGNKSSEGRVLGLLAAMMEAQGDTAGAIQLYEQTLALHRAVGDQYHVGITLGNMGNAYRSQGDFERAFEFQESALAMHRSLNSQFGEGIVLGNLGDTLVCLGRVAEAEEAFREAISIADDTFPLAAGVFRGSLALLLAKQDQLKEAQKLLEKGEPDVVSERVEHLKFLCKKGQVLHLSGDSDGAHASLDQSRKMAVAFQLNDESAVGQEIQALAAMLGGDVPETSGNERDLALAEAKRLLETGVIEFQQDNYEEAMRCYQGALEIFRMHGYRSGEILGLNRIGIFYQRVGQMERAIEFYTQALDIAREIGDKRYEGITLGNLGNGFRAQGQHERAIEFYTQALDVAREIGDKRNEAAHLGNIGIVLQVQGQHGRAIEFYTQALDIAREIGDKEKQFVNLGNLGNACQLQGQYERATEFYTQALAAAREVNNKLSEGIQLGNLGDALVKLGRLDEAEDAFRQATSLCDELIPGAAGAFRGSLALLLAKQDQPEEAQTLLQAGEAQVAPYPDEHAKFLAKKGHVCHLAGDTDGAQASLEQAQALVAELKVGAESGVEKALRGLETVLGSGPPDAPDEEQDLPLLEAERLLELGNLDFEQSHHDEALRRYQEALAIFEKHGDRSGEGRTQGHIGTVYQAQGAHERALAFFTSAVTIAREIGNKSSESMHLGNLAAVYQVQDQANQAIELFSQAIDLAREIRDKRREGIHLGNLGNVYRAQGENERAVDLFTQAAAIAQEIGDKRSEGIGLGNLGDTLTGLGRPKEAEDALKKAISIGDETYPLAADVFRGSLALLLAQHDQIEEAQLLLGKGETWIESQPEEYAKFLGKKAHVQHLAGDVDAARLTLDRARALVDTLNFSEESEIAQSIQNLTTVIGDGTP